MAKTAHLAFAFALTKQPVAVCLLRNSFKQASLPISALEFSAGILMRRRAVEKRDYRTPAIEPCLNINFLSPNDPV
jgi:hypothetical protein